MVLIFHNLGSLFFLFFHGTWIVCLQVQPHQRFHATVLRFSSSSGGKRSFSYARLGNRDAAMITCLFSSIRRESSAPGKPCKRPGQSGNKEFLPYTDRHQKSIKEACIAGGIAGHFHILFAKWGESFVMLHKVKMWG